MSLFGRAVANNKTTYGSGGASGMYGTWDIRSLREKLNLSEDNLTPTGINCPVSGYPLMRVNDTQVDLEETSLFIPGEKFVYVSFSPNATIVFTQEPGSPYFDKEKEGFEMSNWNSTKPDKYVWEESGWKQYKLHSTWGVPIILPADTPDDEVNKIISETNAQIMAGFSGMSGTTGWSGATGTAGPSGILPIAQQVAAKTIGLDLVSVQPLSGPKGIISYLDTQYGNKKIKGQNSQTSSKNRPFCGRGRGGFRGR
jgi:hypothetical protein